MASPDHRRDAVRRRRRTISIRRSLLASLLGVIALLSAAIMGTSIYGGRRASFELSKELTRENIDITAERLRAPAERVAARIVELTGANRKGAE